MLGQSIASMRFTVLGIIELNLSVFFTNIYMLTVKPALIKLQDSRDFVKKQKTPVNHRQTKNT